MNDDLREWFEGLKLAEDVEISAEAKLSQQTRPFRKSTAAYSIANGWSNIWRIAFCPRPASLPYCSSPVPSCPSSSR
ncbi:hypothetical protein OROMI_009865 [Orobanche minor]